MNTSTQLASTVTLPLGLNALPHGEAAFKPQFVLKSEPACDVRPLLSIVVPAYNEASRLPQTLQRILSYLQMQSYPSEVIIVDDGSTDETLAKAREVVEHEQGITLIANPHLGKGYTVRTGMLAAQGEFVLFTDADLSTPIEEVENLLTWFDQGYDVVIGSREGGNVHQRVDEPAHRHLMGRVFNLLVQVLAVPGVRDTQCGFKAMRGAVAQDLFPRLRLHIGERSPIRGPRVTAFDVELLFLARKWGYQIKEVPVRWYYKDGSKVNPIKDTYRNLSDIFMVRWNEVLGRYTSLT